MIKSGAGALVLTGANTFAGNVTIDGGVVDLTTGKLYSGAHNNANVVTVNTNGTLKLNSFAYGAANSLGMLSDYAQRRVINGGTIEVTSTTQSVGTDFTVGANGGTFRYNPADTASTLTLAGNTNTNIPVSGALVFDTLGNIVVGEVIEGTGSLTKTGGQSLTISGASTYAGATTVSAGKLLVNGSLANSDVTVSTGATIGGSGTVKSVVVADGATLSPGNSAGLLTVSGNATLAGLSASTFEIAAAPTTRGTDYDAVNVGGTLVLDGTLTVVATGGFDTTTLVAGATFDLIDAATIDATGFNVDTDLVLPALGAGKFWDKSTFLADGVIRVASSGPSYASWATGMGLTGDAALPGATPYNDGITNLLRYAMNLPAASADAFALAAHSNLVVATGTQDFVMEYRKRKGMTDVTLVVQTSTDLLTWVDATAGTTTQLTDPDADTELYRYTQSVDGTPRYFRVQATLVP